MVAFLLLQNRLGNIWLFKKIFCRKQSLSTPNEIINFEKNSVINGWSQKEAAVFLAAGLRSRAQKNLMVCPIATGEIMAKLLVNRSFPSKFKNR